MERRRTRPLLLPNRRHKLTEEDLRKGTLQGKVVHPERKVKNSARITSKEIVRIRRVVIGILPYVKITNLNRDAHFGDKCMFRHAEADSQPSKKSKKSGVKGSVACLKKSKHVGCVFQDTVTPKSRRFYGRARHLWDQIAPFDSQKARYTTLKSAALVLQSSRMEHKKKPCNKKPAPTEKHGIWRKMSTSSMTGMRPRSSRLLKFGHYQHHLRRNPRDNFVVDSGASMHMLSRKDLNSAELETGRVSRNPPTVVTASGEVQTKKEATVHVHDLEWFVTVQIREDTPAVLSLGKLCEDHGYSYEWTSGQKPQLTKNGKNNFVQYGKCRTDCCPRVGDRFLQLERKFVFYIVTAGHV